MQSLFQRSTTDAPPPQEVNPSRSAGLGTFGGVFTPSLLTILGVIMYLRFGWVVGNAGLIGTLAIVTLATFITFLTSLSISAIATDQRIRIGGAYYMISRSLGIEAGGAVGIPLYFAQALSVALYTIGFAESVVGVFPDLNVKLVGLVTTTVVALVALKSANAAIKAQYVIMVAIVVSLLSFYFGSPIEETHLEMFGASERLSEPFWTVFAVFFPAVTGIMAGVNLSGDLKDPAKSIPKGTLAAVGVGYLIYMTLPIFLALRADAVTLIEDPLIMRKMAVWGDAILLGVWGATLSSAVGSILGAPRVLQALARDRVLPGPLRWLGRGSGAQDEPRIGTAVTCGIATIAVSLGDLNLIAPVLTMFFLTTYGVLNITAGLERFLGNPSYRPKFRVHWFWSLLGAVGCIAVMFLINAVATVVAIFVVIVIFVWLERRALETTWGDVRDGIWMAITRAGLLRLRPNPDPKNWRPHLLVLSGAPRRRWHLIDLAAAITHNRALLTVATVLPEDHVTTERRSGMEATIGEYLAERGVQSLVRVIAAENPYAGAEQLVETYGLGALVPNTILLGGSEDPAQREAYCATIASFHRARRNVVLLHHNEERGFGEQQRIDVWWGGLRSNGGLMMLLAYLIQTSFSWREADVRVKIVVPSEAAAEDARRNLTALVSGTRIGASTHVIVSSGRPFDEILRASSADADLVFLGMAEPTGDFAAYYEGLLERTRGLPTTAFVLAAEEVAFGEMLLEQEPAAEG
ncbi:MAG: Na-K-Cl cotransporter [Rhodothermales bacterium]